MWRHAQVLLGWMLLPDVGTILWLVWLVYPLNGVTFSHGLFFDLQICFWRSASFLCVGSYVSYFQMFFIFTQIRGEMIQFDQYFSKGLKPPTRIFKILPLWDGLATAANRSFFFWQTSWIGTLQQETWNSPHQVFFSNAECGVTIILDSKKSVFLFFGPLPGKNSLLRFDLCFNNKALWFPDFLSCKPPANFIKVESLLVGETWKLPSRSSQWKKDGRNKATTLYCIFSWILESYKFIQYLCNTCQQRCL